MTSKAHFTTRRGFIATAGFGGTALYALWAAYGVAPGPLDLLAPGPDAPPMPSAHAGHGGGETMADAPPPPDVAAFEAEVQEFVSRFEQPDGSVFPQAIPGPQAVGHGADSHAGHSMAMPAMDHMHMPEMPGMAMPGMNMGPAAERMAPDDHAAQPEAIAVSLLASRWSYEPAHLRLEAGQAYRFRMMATDVAHGASIQFGTGGRMIRLRPGQLVEQDFTFHQPGEFLVICTFFCGAGHDAMQARISVMEGDKA